MGLLTTQNIPYFEYRAINELRQAHQTESGSNLVAFIVFGDLIATGESYDIHVLEVVRSWSGASLHTFATSESLYLRGTLFLNFLSPEEFESHSSALARKPNTGDIVSLLEQVRRAYVVMYEEQEGYVTRILEGDQASKSADNDKTNPLSLRDLAAAH